MQRWLQNKHIVIGITGGIAAYKSADLVRKLREAGAAVRVVMTEHAKEFITPLTMQAVSGHPVHDELFDLKAEAAMGHIELARWADLLIIAPATANFIAELSQGGAKGLLGTVCLATIAPIVVVPAMNQAMWKNTLTQQNVQELEEKGILLFGPAEGSQACGDTGPGRMLEPLEIVQRLATIFMSTALTAKKVVITAGPTQEPIDPVRYISNASSGKMGYALAEAAIEAGAEVILISGPVAIPPPSRVKMIRVVTAEEMLSAVKKEVVNCDVFLSVAAVADYRCKTIATKKIPKREVTLTLELERNPDIITYVAQQTPRPFVVGFAAETDELIERAKGKLKNKNLDMIIANRVGEGLGIGSEENAVSVLWENKRQDFSTMSKKKLALALINLIGQQIKSEVRECRKKE